ncbi:MAG: hypothetical protein ACJ716_06975 [Marmoricola sp.]
MRKIIASLSVLVATVAAAAVLSPRPADAGVALETGRALQALPASTQPMRVALDGAWVYVALRSTSAPSGTPWEIYRAAADGTGSWAPVHDPDTDAIVTTTSSLTVRDGYVLVVPAQDSVPPCTDYQLVGPAHSRTFNSCGYTALIDGGRLERTASSTGPWLLETVAGAGLRSLSYLTVVSGNRGWYLDGSQRLKGVDVSTGAALPSKPLPGSCQPFSVNGAAAGYVVVECLNQTAVVDVDGALPPWPLGAGSWGLGTGFAGAGAGAGDLAIEDLGQGKAIRHFAVGSSGRWSPDAGGAPQAAFLTPDQQVAMADLAPLASRNASAEDGTAPAVFVYPGQESPVRPAPGGQYADLSYTWGGSDPGHPSAVSFDAEQSYRLDGQTRSWNPVLTDSAQTSQDQFVESGTEYCLRVRARDWAGNVSGWTDACTVIDGQRPTVRWTMHHWEGIHPALSNHPVELSWSGTDFGGLAYSALSERVAVPGHSGTTWRTPSHWQYVAKTKAWGYYEAGDTVCFRVRMRDVVGFWSSALATGTRCTSIPYDDRYFATSGTALRARSPLKLGGTYTRLRDASSWMQRSGLRMRAVDILFSPYANDVPNIPRIYIGNHLIDRAVTYFYDGTRVWVRYPILRTLDGTLKIRGNDMGEIRVDAVAIEH